MGQGNSQLDNALGCCKSGSAKKQITQKDDKISTKPRDVTSAGGIPAPHIANWEGQRVSRGRHSEMTSPTFTVGADIDDIHREPPPAKETSRSPRPFAHIAHRRPPPTKSPNPEIGVQSPMTDYTMTYQDLTSKFDVTLVAQPPSRRPNEVVSDPLYGRVHRFNDKDMSLTLTPDQSVQLDDFYSPPQEYSYHDTLAQRLDAAGVTGHDVPQQSRKSAAFSTITESDYNRRRMVMPSVTAGSKSPKVEGEVSPQQIGAYSVVLGC